MMDVVLIKLFLSHIVGDFILQPDHWIKDKEKRKTSSGYLYLHILLHAVLLVILLQESGFVWLIVILTLLHGIIDAIKLHFQSDGNRRSWFFADQILHVLSIVIVWYLFVTPQINFTFINDKDFLIKVLAVAFITFPSAVIIRIIINKWNPEIAGSAKLPLNEAGNSLQSAGTYIGIIERLLVFTFALVAHWEAIGFLIAAKSIFRFGDLKEAKDLKLSEIIGTLVLIFVIFHFTQGELGPEKTPIGLGSLGAVPVTFLVWAIGLSLGGTTGYAINPARDLGPRIMHAILPIPDKGSSDWSYSWIPVVGPIVGAVIAALLYLWFSV